MKTCRDGRCLGRDSNRTQPNKNLEYYRYANPLDIQRYQAEKRYIDVTFYVAVINLITCSGYNSLRVATFRYKGKQKSVVSIRNSPGNVASNYSEKCFEPFYISQ
jgi:hypothetical protein